MIKDQISIIMSVYNCEELVRDSVDSVLAQTYSNWKFIICDDCSTDGTLSVLKEYELKYPDKFLIIKNEKNLRLAASLNHCLQYAEGEFCARMDGDDYIAPNRFEEQIKFLKQHPEIQLVGTLMQKFNENGFGAVVSYKEYPDKYDLRFGPCFAHASIMTYTEVYKNLGGYTVSNRTKRTQDYDLWFRFYAKGYKGANIQAPLYYVRDDEYAFLRRKANLYFWAVVTRWKGFRMLHYPIKYYWRVLSPIGALIRNEARKSKAKRQLKKKKKE